MIFEYAIERSIKYLIDYVEKCNIKTPVIRAKI